MKCFYPSYTFVSRESFGLSLFIVCLSVPSPAASEQESRFVMKKSRLGCTNEKLVFILHVPTFVCLFS